MREYQVGDEDFADLIDVWRELLQYHVSELQLEAQLRQTLASLERVVGGLVPPTDDEVLATPPAEAELLPLQPNGVE
jgi:outer membrane protein TolC